MSSWWFIDECDNDRLKGLGQNPHGVDLIYQDMLSVFLQVHPRHGGPNYSIKL